MIATEAAPAHQQGKAAFDHPSSGQGAKAFGKEVVPIDLLSLRQKPAALGYSERAHRLHSPAQMDLQPLDEAARVMTIAPDQLQSGKRCGERLKHLLGAILIGAMGSRDFTLQQIALCVNAGVPFATPDFFSPYRSPFQGRERPWF